jgi:uncharacterized protein YprB with RNaseH-like and TPR domain
MPDPLAIRLNRLRRALQQRSDSERAEGATGQLEEREYARPEPAASSTQAAGGPAAGLESWERTGELTYRRVLRFDSPLAGERLCDHLLPGGLSAGDLLFFDTETTGLSGGAGTLVFLVALGRLAEDRLEVEQHFLADYPGEPAFLQQLAPALRSAGQFVSYNGRTFDAPVLAGRFALNRLSLELRGHNDLVYWARRLWKRALGDCSLGSIEREVLGVRRGQDVAGHEVPGIYLDYLRRGWSPRLPLVWEHNLQDVRSLAALFARLNRVLLGDELPEGADLASLGSWLLNAGSAERGLQLLRRSFEQGDERAGRALGLHLKRAGRWEEAAEVWLRLAADRHSLFAAVELAKHAEHRLRDPLQALEWVLQVLGWGLPLETRLRRELHRRRARLERLAERRAQAPK